MDSRLAIITLGILYLSTKPVLSTNSPYFTGGDHATTLRQFQQACPAGCDCSDSISDGLKVDCSDMNLQGIPSGISSLTECLDLSLNNISTIEVKTLEGLRQLKILRLSANSLKELPQNVFSGLKKLEILHLQDNRLTSIPPNVVNRLPNLKDLNLGANYISSISSNAFARLEKLEHVWLDDNELSEIPARAFKKTPAIKALNMGMNKITSIRNGDLDDLPLLKVLLLKHNLLIRIENHAFERLESIQIIDLSYNRLSSLPSAIKGALKLRTLTLSNNQIATIPDLAFAGIPQLSELALKGNPITHVERTAFTGLQSLKELSLENVEQLSEFPDLSGCSQLRSLVLSGGKLRGIPQEFCGNVPNLQKINLRHNRLTTIAGLQDCSNLYELDVSENEITVVEANQTRNLTNIKSLNFGDNKISRLDEDVFSNMKHIEKLNLARNTFTYLPMQGLDSLLELNISGVRTMLYLPPVELFLNLRSLAAYYPYHCCQVEKIHSKPADSAFLRHSDDIMASIDVGDIPMTSPVQCSPSVGPMTPCDSLLPSTPIRVFWWTAVVLSFLLNGIIILACAIRFCARRISRRPTAVPSDEEMLRRIDSDSRYSSENRVAVLDTDVANSHYCLNIGRNGTITSDNESFHATLCHLTLADIFVTVYTAMVLSYDHSTRGEFAVHGAWWQQSPLCHSAGFFLTFGTQLAFGTICVMTVERYLAIIHPLQTERHMRKNMLIIALASVWVISIATGIVTLFGGIEYKDDDTSLNTLPAKRGATCLPWTTEFIYVTIMVSVHVIICVVTCVLCGLMFCGKSKQSWLITRRGSRTQVVLTMAVNILFILPLALLAVFISGYLTYSDSSSSSGDYASQGDGYVLFDMGSILSFAMFAIPFRPLLNPILFLIFNKPLRKDIAYVVKNALTTNSSNRTFQQSHSSILEPMFDSDMNSVVQSGLTTNYPIINRVYNNEEIMRPSLAYDNRGIVSSSSVSYHAPSLSLGNSSSNRPGGNKGSNSERKRRKRYTRSQRSERIATDTDPTTESEVITFHKGGHAVYYNPDSRERWRKKLSVRYGGISARDEFQSLVFPRHHQSSSEQETNSTIYPIMPSTISALTRSSCARHPSINESCKNLSCDADASDVSSVDYSCARYQYHDHVDSTNIKAHYNTCEQSAMMVDPREEYTSDSDAYDADKEIALITSFMMADCKAQSPVVEDSNTVKRLHCDHSRNPNNCTRQCDNETDLIAPCSVDIRDHKRLVFQPDAAFLRRTSHSSTNNVEAHLSKKFGNSCEYCDSSTSKDSGIHSEIDSTSGASYSDTSMSRRLHYSTGNSAMKSLAENAVSRHYDISSHNICVISSMDNSGTITSSPSNNTETISRDASSNTLT